MKGKFVCFLLLTFTICTPRWLGYRRTNPKNKFSTPNKNKSCYICTDNRNPKNCKNISCHDDSLCKYDVENILECCRALNCSKNIHSDQETTSFWLKYVFIFLFLGLMLLLFLKKKKNLPIRRPFPNLQTRFPNQQNLHRRWGTSYLLTGARNHNRIRPNINNEEIPKYSKTLSCGGKIIKLPNYDEFFDDERNACLPSYDYYIQNKHVFNDD
ncbi:hypothetical protein HZS_6074, partial [Henneguya salminicola]